MRPGCFITFEGGEGAGKTTQIAYLKQRLEEQGRHVLALREPGGTTLGEVLRTLIKHPAEPLAPRAETLLFLAARAQLVHECILPALQKGMVVICDRFIDSTVVYQGVARGLGADEVAQLNAWVIGSSWPDVTFFLDLPAKVGLERAALRGEAIDMLEAQPLAFHETVRLGYHHLAQQEPQRIATLDAQQSSEALAEIIWQFLVNKNYV